MEGKTYELLTYCLLAIGIIDTVGVVRSESVHESQKSVDLLAYLIRTYTNPDETVLDNTMGSGRVQE